MMGEDWKPKASLESSLVHWEARSWQVNIPEQGDENCDQGDTHIRACGL
jgi:hypothetical protein